VKPSKKTAAESLDAAADKFIAAQELRQEGLKDIWGGIKKKAGALAAKLPTKANKAKEAAQDQANSKKWAKQAADRKAADSEHEAETAASDRRFASKQAAHDDWKKRDDKGLGLARRNNAAQAERDADRAAARKADTGYSGSMGGPKRSEKYDSLSVLPTAQSLVEFRNLVGLPVNPEQAQKADAEEAFEGLVTILNNGGWDVRVESLAELVSNVESLIAAQDSGLDEGILGKLQAGLTRAKKYVAL